MKKHLSVFGFEAQYHFTVDKTIKNFHKPQISTIGSIPLLKITDKHQYLNMPSVKSALKALVTSKNQFFKQRLC